jgi:hypothetical protein
MDTPPAVIANTIMILLGGISIPEGPEAAFTAAEKFLSYPSFSSRGASMLPIAAVAAMPEPETHPNNMLATILVWAR